MIKVGFYLGEVDLRCGGVGPYSQRVLRALAAQHVSHPIELTVIGAESNALQDGNFPFTAISTRGESAASAPQWRQRLNNAWQVLAGRSFPEPAPCPMATFLDSLRLDVVHVPYQISPSFQMTTPVIVTMHDVQEVHLPRFFTAEERRERAHYHLQSLRQAAAVVVSYDHVKQDLLTYFNCPDEQVVVIPLPIEQCAMASPPARLVAEYQRKYSAYDRYFLYPAQTWEHKNHLRLIDAFEAVCQRVPEPLGLICTGKKNAFFDKIDMRLRRSPVASRILFAGIVDEGELHWLYSNSLGVVIPTLYEAGSFPLIEAMQLGVPVVCANTTSLPDAVGDAQFLFDPWDVEQIAVAMTRLAVDAEFRAASIRNGRQRILAMQGVNVSGHYEALWIKVASARRSLASRLFSKSA